LLEKLDHKYPGPGISEVPVGGRGKRLLFKREGLRRDYSRRMDKIDCRGNKGQVGWERDRPGGGSPSQRKRGGMETGKTTGRVLCIHLKKEAGGYLRAKEEEKKISWG